MHSQKPYEPPKSLVREELSIGSYPTYHALWHLYASGVVCDLENFHSPAWDAVENLMDGGRDFRPGRVALIDTHVAWSHPNLIDAIDKVRMFDLTGNKLGAFTVPETDFSQPEKDARKVVSDAARDMLKNAQNDDPLKSFYAELAGYRPGDHAGCVHPASAHGTAMAGLIGARPVPENGATAHVPASQAPFRPEPKAVKIALPYAGVDPYGSIIPIAVDTAPDPEQILYALAYARLTGADIIVFAATLSDPKERVTGYGKKRSGEQTSDTPGKIEEHYRAVESGQKLLQDVGATIAARPAKDQDKWDHLKEYLIDTSHDALLLCSAGNSDDGLLAYPARLARDDNGIVAVGARASSGLRASYSAGDRKGMEVSIFAYSGDGQELEIGKGGDETLKENVRLDPYAAAYGPDAEKMLSLYKVNGGTPHRAKAVEDLITTDIPGRLGYNPSPIKKKLTAKDDHIYDVASYYCRFSGTSGATAVLAGLISLAIGAGKYQPGDLTPAQYKNKILIGLDDYNPTTGEPVANWDRVKKEP